MDTYALIYTIFIIFCICLLLLDDHVICTSYQEIIIVGLLIITTSLIAAFRPMNSPDTELYAKAYYSSTSIIRGVRFSDFSDIFANRQYYSIELGYIFFMAFFKKICSFRTFLFINSVLSNTLIIYGLNSLTIYLNVNNESNITRYYDRHNVSNSGIISLFAMYMAMCGVLYSSVAIRAGLSIGLGFTFLAYTLRDGKRLIWSILLAIASLLIHTTGIIFVVFFILLNIIKVKINPSIIRLIWIVLASLYFLNIAKYTIPVIMNIKYFIFEILHINAFNSYFVNYQYNVQLREGLIIVLIGIILWIIYYGTRTDSSFAIIILIGMAIETFAYPVHAISRLVDFFYIFLIPMTGYYAMYIDHRKYFATECLFAFMYVPQFVMIFMRE